MEAQVSKSNFKAHALEIMRDVEETGSEVVITAHGRPALVVSKYTSKETSPLELLRGSVIEFISPTDPVAEDEWELS